MMRPRPSRRSRRLRLPLPRRNQMTRQSSRRDMLVTRVIVEPKREEADPLLPVMVSVSLIVAAELDVVAKLRREVVDPETGDLIKTRQRRLSMLNLPKTLLPTLMMLTLLLRRKMPLSRRNLLLSRSQSQRLSR